MTHLSTSTLVAGLVLAYTLEAQKPPSCAIGARGEARAAVGVSERSRGVDETLVESDDYRGTCASDRKRLGEVSRSGPATRTRR